MARKQTLLSVLGSPEAIADVKTRGKMRMRPLSVLGSAEEMADVNASVKAVLKPGVNDENDE